MSFVATTVGSMESLRTLQEGGKTTGEKTPLQTFIPYDVKVPRDLERRLLGGMGGNQLPCLKMPNFCVTVAKKHERLLVH